MSVRFGGHSEYVNVLNFWKSLEQQYLERRRQLYAEKERLLAARAAAERARRDGLDPPPRPAPRHDTESATEDDRSTLPDAEDDEFSDVDAEFWVDPGEQYYSSLERDRWLKLQSELASLQQWEAGRGARVHRSFVRGLIMGALLIAALLLTAIWVAAQVTREPEAESCGWRCGEGPSLTTQLLSSLFPMANADDEV